MQPENAPAFLAVEQTFERLLLALQPVNGLRLRPVFIDGEHETAVEQFFIDVDCCCRQKDHHRAFDAVLVRDELSRRGVLSGRGNRE